MIKKTREILLKNRKKRKENMEQFVTESFQKKKQKIEKRVKSKLL